MNAFQKLQSEVKQSLQRYYTQEHLDFLKKRYLMKKSDLCKSPQAAISLDTKLPGFASFSGKLTALSYKRCFSTQNH